MEKIPNMDFQKISLRGIILDILDLFVYLKKKWKQVLVVAIFGAIIGVSYAVLYPVKYVSTTSFVIEESKPGLGGISSLAGQFGIDLAGGSGGGFFSGDNVLYFLKSENLCREVLLSPYGRSTKTLADVYIESSGLKRKWLKNKKIGDIEYAKFTNTKLPRKEDSLLQYIIRKRILKNELAVSRPDKKSSFIFVQTAMRDEKLSFYFSERLIQIASKKYLDSKLKYKIQNLATLQRRADSLQDLLNAKTSNAASTQQNLMDGNPGLRLNLIKTEISSREKNMVGTIFAEVVKNLEISKTILSQETPVIEIIDKSSFPLHKDKQGVLESGVVFSFFSIMIYVVFATLSYWLYNYPNRSN